ncbi:hypothetical protein CAPN010_11000 [Capnocytophaga cynodegmi]|uniref:hypothetical protein n=1 Tax=Capnocytophaga cynodegmi TaxID=28189 RepID=UPI001EE3965F|nr:hypothetical protein [Capnocytophaga cynodegmi]GJQ06942.1 hypothetical protein CAPN010_11000 [Capnocytophaga cynodegmi]
MLVVAKQQIYGRASKMVRAEKGDRLKVIKKQGDVYILQKGNLPPFPAHCTKVQVIENK